MYPADSLESEPAELLVVAVGDGLDQRRQEPAEPLAVDDLVADRVRADPGEEGGGEEEALMEQGVVGGLAQRRHALHALHVDVQRVVAAGSCSMVRVRLGLG